MRELEDADLCFFCFDGSADAERAAGIVVAARKGSRAGRIMLAQVEDAAALDVVIDAVDDPATRIPALEALGGIGDPRGMPVAIRWLDDPDPAVRHAAIACLAELGPVAADTIASRLDVPDDREAAAIALAWLRDDRATQPLVDLVAGEPLPRLVVRPGNAYRQPIAALAWLDDPRALDAIAALAERAVAPASSDDPPWVVGDTTLKVWIALQERSDPAATAILERLAAATGNPYLVRPPARRHRAPDDPRRTVTRWAMTLRPVEAPIVTPVTKFGGQPVWRGVPAWPIAADGAPMVFFAQFAIPWTDRVAYLFIDPAGDVESLGSLLCQPGPAPARAMPTATGPSMTTEITSRERFVLHRIDRHVESVVDLEPGHDPESWADVDGSGEGPDDDRDWNKIGGTPRWLQYPDTPEGPGWRFLFQFTASWAGHELGDGAEVYGFVHDDGRGWIAIQGH